MGNRTFVCLRILLRTILWTFLRRTDLTFIQCLTINIHFKYLNIHLWMSFIVLNVFFMIFKIIQTFLFIIFLFGISLWLVYAYIAVSWCNHEDPIKLLSIQCEYIVGLATSVWVVGEVVAIDEAIQKHWCLSTLVFWHHMTCSFYWSEGKSSQFPNHTSHLVFVFMQAWSPPFPPLVDYWQSELVL